LEVADVFVVNKADRPGASDTRRDLEMMLELSHVTGQENTDYRPPILMTNSLDGDGVPEVAAAVASHLDYLQSSEQLGDRRRNRARLEVASRVQELFERSLAAALGADDAGRLLNQVVSGNVPPTSAARSLAEQLLRTDLAG